MGQGFGSKLEASRGVVAGRAGGFGAGGSLCEEPVSLAVRPGKRCRGLAALVSQGVSVIFSGDPPAQGAAGSLAGDVGRK